MHLLIQQRLQNHIYQLQISQHGLKFQSKKLKYSVTNEPKPQLKHGRPIGSRDTIPRKRKSVKSDAPEEHDPKEHTNVKGLNDELITPAKASTEKLSHEIVPVHTMKRYLLIIYIREKYGIEILPL